MAFPIRNPNKRDVQLLKSVPNLFFLCLLSYGGSLQAQTESPQPSAEKQSQGSGDKTSEVNLSEINWDEEETEETESTSVSDLQNINWDEEDAEDSAIGEAESDSESGTSTSSLQSINWDDEDSDDESADFIPPPESRKASEELSEGEIMLIHWSGSILFFALHLYEFREWLLSQKFEIVGAFSTGYFDHIAYALASGMGHATFFQKKKRR
jgi:hypothetical protein